MRIAGIAFVAALATVLAGSRVHVTFDKPFETVSHLGGALRVAEATLGLEDASYFVGPTFTGDGHDRAEHLHGNTCRRSRSPASPPPDIAPPCS